MALRCYPLQPGGLLALEALFIGMTTPAAVYAEVIKGIDVVLLLVFMVASIYFMREPLLHMFTSVLLKVRSKALLALLFCGIAAVLSAFLDALTVTAVVITVAAGFYGVYHRAASGKAPRHADHDAGNDAGVLVMHAVDLEQFLIPIDYRLE
jgi:NhaB family Na+:H+ antiporter